MATRAYYVDGKRVPGVTTVIGTNLGWNKGQLMHWAFNQGKEGRETLYEVRDKAAEAGTLAHEMVEAHIKGYEMPDMTKYPEDIADLASRAYRNYLEWEANVNLRIVETELSLVSNRYKYGGTIDAIALVGMRLIVTDWKTSNGLYPDHLIQLAAYGQLITENTDFDITGYHLIRFDKEHGDFAHHFFDDLSDGWETFTHLLKLHELKKRLERRTR